MSSRNRYKKSDAYIVVIETYLLKVLPTEKSLVVSFWTFFEISQQPRRIRKNRNPKFFVDAEVSF